MIDGITTYGSDELINQIKYGEPVFNNWCNWYN